MIEVLSEIENVNLKSALVQPITMLDGKIQKLVMLIDTHVENANKIRVKRGIDAELDVITERYKNWTNLQKFGKKTSKNFLFNFTNFD